MKFFSSKESKNTNRMEYSHEIQAYNALFLTKVNVKA